MLDSICLVIMGNIENIERQIEALSPEELAQPCVVSGVRLDGLGPPVGGRYPGREA
jgi:hypothetical protein